MTFRISNSLNLKTNQSEGEGEGEGEAEEATHELLQLSKKLDSLRVWKEKKQNGFLSSSSSSRGGISVSVQNTSVVSSSHCGRRGRKSNKDHVKKMELAKRQQVDSFTNVAATTGLLNGSNLGDYKPSASVASQWLQLLQQDIKGCLSVLEALWSSKERV
ncbi:hypothetical protein SLEP1_g11287 [Rubroshorea leprosula]|uniref:Uncharacterized protein n=1 Tax=Rubroshorea leprosula TaxID=152421 RepID=A0AAV5IK34_9ROSI|nr:hypothetical protein SLEP1_g11287 [Rubroshorea leprosula]